MTSTFLIVDSLWAIIMVLLSFCAFSRASCTIPSLCASSAEVASSNSNNFGSLTKALAMAILCFWPPESWEPLSPTNVL